MYSVDFPDILSSSKMSVIKDHAATLSNLKLLLLSEKGSLFGDPYYGTNLQKIIFQQNNGILRDLVVDDIYTAIQTFMPQLTVKRTDIVLTSVGTNLVAQIKVLNNVDYTTDLFEISLTTNEPT